MDGTSLPFHQRDDGKRYFTNADLAEMVENGLIDPDDRWELIEGEWFDMPSEGFEHLMARTRLLREFVLALGRDSEWIAGSQGSIFLASDVEVRPDLIVHLADVRSNAMSGDDILLVVELMKSSQQRDMERKRPVYAAAGIKELWLADLDQRVVHVCREPEGRDYRAVRTASFDEAVRPASLTLDIIFSQLV